jgi:hypothetical protein
MAIAEHIARSLADAVGFEKRRGENSEGAMTMPDSNHEFFEMLGKILFRCWIFGFVLMFVWVGVFISAGISPLVGDMVFGLHGGMFGLSRHELSLVHYSGLAAAKLIVTFVFFIPWLAIRLVLRRQTRP